MKKITVLGSFSGRNSGDAAILASIVSEITSLYPNVQFEVPTINPSYILNEFPNGNVKPISAMPWNLSLRLLGIPVFRSVARTDITLITAGVLNDLRLFNPAFSFLLALFFVIPFAKKLNKSVICYCVGVGPLMSYWGKRMTKYICNDNCDLIMMREDDSYELLKGIGVVKPPMDVYADAAFNNTPSSPSRINEILREENIDKTKNLIGLNITSYVGDWLKKEDRVSKESFRQEIIQTVDQLIADLNVNVVFVVTQMMDIAFAEEVRKQVKNQESVRIVTLEQYNNHEIMGLLGELDLFIGMRLHSLILASAMGTPVVGINYHPKVGSILRFIGQHERIIELNETNSITLFSMVEGTFSERDRIKDQLKLRISEIKNQARKATDRLVENYLR